MADKKPAAKKVEVKDKNALVNCGKCGKQYRESVGACPRC